MSGYELKLLLQELESLIQIFSFKATIPGMDRNDIMQELRLKVIDESDRFVSNKANPKTFASVVFRNHLIRLHRDYTRSKRLIDPLPDMLLYDGFEEMGVSDIIREYDLTRCFDEDTISRLLEWERQNEQREVCTMAYDQ